MELKVNGYVFNLYNQVNINLKYDSIADTFSFKFYFDPTDSTHIETFRPGSYHSCTIWHKGVLLMTGTVLSPYFSSAGDPPKSLVTISGYSVTGVLNDSCILKDAFTNEITENSNNSPIDSNSLTEALPPSLTQFDGLTLTDIANRVCVAYGFNVMVDDELKGDVAFNTPYTHVSTNDPTETSPDQTVADFLDGLCKQKNVILSHTQDGEVFLTRVKADSLLTDDTTLAIVSPVSFSNDISGAPSQVLSNRKSKKNARPILYDFSDPTTWLDMSLSFNGQPMHSIIQVVGQISSNTPDTSLDSAVVNPYANGIGVKRYTRVIQRSGDTSDTPKTARAILGDELKNIVLTIKIPSWELSGNVVTPNQMISAMNPEVFLFQKTNWFIQEVDFEGNEREETAVLTCVPPEAFNKDIVKNIFA